MSWQGAFYNGQITYGSQWAWWMFGVDIYDDPGNPDPISGYLLTDVAAMINKYKPVRCELEDMRYVMRQTSGLQVDDTSITISLI